MNTRQPHPKKQPQLGIISLVLGIVSIFTGTGALTGIPGLIVGIVSLIKKEPSKWLAIVGIITSIIGIVITILVLVFFGYVLYGLWLGMFGGAMVQS